MISLKSWRPAFAYSVCLLIVLAASHSYCLGAEDADVVRDVLIARLGKLSNLIANYDETIRYPPLLPGREPVTKFGDGFVIINTGVQEYDHKFSYLEGRSRYDAHLLSHDRGDVKIDVPVSDTVLQIRTYSKDRAEMFNRTKTRDSEITAGEIRNELALPKDPYLETALGMRIVGSGERLAAESISEMEVTFSDEVHVKLSPINEDRVRSELVLSPKLGYAPVSFTIHSAVHGRIILQMDMSEFKNVNGLMLPHKIDAQRYAYYKGKEKLKAIAKTITVREYRIDDPENTPDKYRIKWPDGTYIRDRRSETTWKVVNGKLTNPSVERLVAEAVNETGDSPPIQDAPLTDKREPESVTPTVDTPNTSSPAPDEHSKKNLVIGLAAALALVIIVISAGFIRKTSKSQP